MLLSKPRIKKSLETGATILSEAVIYFVGSFMIQSVELMPTHDSGFKQRAKGLKILRASLTLFTHRAFFKFSRLLLKMLSFSRGRPISWV